MNKSDYSLTGESARAAVANGLADAEWYTTQIPRAEMRKLLERCDGPAIRDTLLWLGILIISGVCGFMLWGTWWAIIPFVIYGIIYGTTSDSRWHETSHGTAFKTGWMNTALYHVASFMVVREPEVWRWSHTRHHSDTIIVGRDPEIAAERPPDLLGIAMAFLALKSTPATLKNVLLHATGQLTADEKNFIPEESYHKVFRTARVWILIYAVTIASCFYYGSILPLMYIGLPSIYGAWLMPIFGLTQHVGLAENVLDHRLNCRTVKMNPVFRYLYWNMNYHIEHHMFPLVPYHKLPRLHELVKDDHPAPYNSTWEAWTEIISALLRQRKDPTYFVERKLPETNRVIPQEELGIYSAEPSAADAEGWIQVCPADALVNADAVRFNCGESTYAVYRNAVGDLRASDGICTHGRTHLAEGFVVGEQIECPKHNGRFDMRDGSVKRDPVCVGLCTYKVEERDGYIVLNLNSAGGVGAELVKKTRSFKVVSNRNVATYIKELILEPAEKEKSFEFTPGDYMQLNIPPYDRTLEGVEIDEPFSGAWAEKGYLEGRVSHDTLTRRNYSVASSPSDGGALKFNVRFSPPMGNYQAGVGSSYVFGLKEGDTVEAIGPFGDFHIKPTESEMVYIGGGAGMAPLRSHIAHLFETLKTGRPVSFWYGARSLNELFYTEYFEALAEQFENFSFHVALSEPKPEDNWEGPVGFIHDLVEQEHMKHHAHPDQAEYYLCGPPAMVQAVQNLLANYSVPHSQIAFDEF